MVPKANMTRKELRLLNVVSTKLDKIAKKKEEEK